MGLKSIIKTSNTITKADVVVTVQDRYFISSLKLDVVQAALSIRRH